MTAQPLQRLVGTWDIAATHPAMPDVVVRGAAISEWLEGEQFLIHRSRLEHELFPDSISVIGVTDTDRVDDDPEAGPSPDAQSPMTMHYFDSRGVFRVYEVEVDEHAWRIWREAPGFSQRFEGTFADGGDTIAGLWQLRTEETWDDDLRITYRRQDAEPFVPADFAPPTRLDHPAFRLRPLGAEHNERDHAAWMGSIDHIRATPGFPDGRWPRPMSLDQNLADLQRHHDHFRDRVGFTYTVLEARGPADRAEVIGCVYIYPDDRPDTAVHVQSWVRADLADLDALLATTVRKWLEDAWPWRPEQIRDHPRRTAG